MLLKNAVIFNDRFEQEKSDILIKGENIAEVGKMSEKDSDGVYDLTGCKILPGLIDIHIHGFAGGEVCEADEKSLETMSTNLVERGITSFCPASMTFPYEVLERVFKNVHSYMGREKGSYIHGMNMEGPYISVAKKGAQNEKYIRKPNAEEFIRLWESCGGIIKLVDIAPENEGSDEFIRQISKICRVSIAHTAATYREAKHSFDMGISHATHLFNAMTGLKHREAGVVGAVFDSSGITAEIICDGLHIYPEVLRIAFKILGEDRTVIISDSMQAAGMPDGKYVLGGHNVYVRDGKAKLADGTIAASTTNVYDELKNVISYGIPLKQAVKSCTINPAKVIGADDITGSIKIGKRADLLVADENMNVKMVIVKGKIKFTK